METIDKLKTIQSIILEVLGNNNIDVIRFRFEYDAFDSIKMKIIFVDNYFVTKVCAILQPLSIMYINFYIDYDAKLEKIVCEIF
jgi:hypothetical protein